MQPMGKTGMGIRQVEKTNQAGNGEIRGEGCGHKMKWGRGGPAKEPGKPRGVGKLCCVTSNTLVLGAATWRAPFQLCLCSLENWTSFFFLAESGVWGAIDESLEKKVGVQYLSLVREADGDGGCGI